jgi:hypothetical protein
MSDIRFVLVVALGVALAVVYPPLRGFILRQFPPQAGPFPSWLKSALKKYGGLFAFCVIAAIILVMVFRGNSNANPGFWAALAMGFGFEASIEKLAFPRTNTSFKKD